MTRETQHTPQRRWSFIPGAGGRRSSAGCGAVAELGQGVLWQCCPFKGGAGPEPATAELLAASAASACNLAGIPPSEVQAALLAAADRSGAGAGAGGEPPRVRVLVPETWEELDCLRWDGDGHFCFPEGTQHGPPTLGQIVSFLRVLDRESAGSSLTIFLSSEERRATGAVLAGARLVLSEGFTADEAWAELLRACPAPSASPKEAWDRFPSPFSRTRATGASSLTVHDCLAGLEAASARGWMEDYRAFNVSAWRQLRRQLDASWLIPGEVLAMGNPTTAARNPAFPGLLDCKPGSNWAVGETDNEQPVTCKLGGGVFSGFWADCGSPPQSPNASPTVKEVSLPSVLSNSSIRTSAASTMACLDEWEFDVMDVAPEGSVAQTSSEHTSQEQEQEQELISEDPPKVPRTYAASDGASPKPGAATRAVMPLTAAAGGPRPGAQDDPDLSKDEGFVDYFLRKRVRAVARLNHDFECPEQMLHAELFMQAGLRLDVTAFTDGDIPPKATVTAFLAICRHQARKEPGSAIAVHCMGGLGRTGVMVGAYACLHHGVNGKAFHGWCRLCRPGSVQTVKQEVFLRCMAGKTKVKRMSDYLGKVQKNISSSNLRYTTASS